MRVFLANDTGRLRHAGCQAVMRSLNHVLAEIPELEIVATHHVGETEIDAAAFDSSEVLFVNGEGTIHHDLPRSRFLLRLLARAKLAGKQVVLANALFQQYTYRDRNILGGLALLAVREPRSAAFASCFGGKAKVLLDSAADRRFLADGKARPLKSGLVIGGWHQHAPLAEPLSELSGVNLTAHHGHFEDIVATLRNAEVYLTGQHHGVYAAALAGCAFVAVPSNSHKIEGFVEWTGLPIPICYRANEITGAITFVRRNPLIFSDLTAFLAEQSVLTAEILRDSLGLG